MSVNSSNKGKKKENGDQKKNKKTTKKKANAKKQKKNKNKRKPVLFFKVTLTILAIFTAVVAAGWGLTQVLIKPPPIPDMTPDEIDYDTVAFVPPETDNEDLLINKGLHAPEGFTTADRKELFYTFVIIGMDGGVNTDTIMVASYDGVNKEAHVIGVPRDCMVNVSRRVKKINASYPAGTLNGGGREGGIDQLKRELKSIIGFTPDFSILVDFKAFEAIIDALGGIDVDVPFDMKYDDPEQNLHTNISTGMQTLNGANALKFARYRKGNYGYQSITDYQRIENQQTVIQAAIDKLLRPSSLIKIPEFIGIFEEYVYSDIGLENLLWFADQLNGIRGTDALQFHTMPTKGTGGAPNWYEFLDDAAVIDLVNTSVNPFTKNIVINDVDIIDHE